MLYEPLMFFLSWAWFVCAIIGVVSCITFMLVYKDSFYESLLAVVATGACYGTIFFALIELKLYIFHFLFCTC